MDRMLLVKGVTLIETWEYLTPAHLNSWMETFFPVAFKENEHGEFGAYPTDVYCKGSIIQSEPKPIVEVLDPEYTYTIGWDTAIDHKNHGNMFVNELYFSVISVDAYLRTKGFRLNDHKDNSWITRVKQAKQAALSLNIEYNRENKFGIDSKEFRIWFDYVSSIQTKPTIRLSLKILLESLAGMSNAELKAKFSRTSIPRYKSFAKKFIAKNNFLFSQLPKLPL